MFSNTSKTAGIAHFFESSGLVILIIFSIILLLFIVINTIIKLKGTSLKSKTFLKNPVKPSNEIMQFVASDNELPPFNNGNEFAYSFWIYVDSINMSDHNLVFLQSLQKDINDIKINDSNFIVYLEKKTNKLKFKFKTANAENNNVTIDMSSAPKLKKGIDGILTINGDTRENIDFNSDTCYYSEYIIDYLPLQKWINIIINVENNLVSIYLDGELLQTKNLNTQSTTNNSCKTETLNNIISNKGGNIIVGSNPKNTLVSFEGLLSKFQIFNYSINDDYVKNIYKQGPLQTSSLSKIGIPLYGIRNPFYKVDDIIVTQ